MTLEEDIKRIKKESPKLYQSMVKRGLLEEKDQTLLSGICPECFFGFIMNRNTSEHLNIYNKHANRFMRELEKEVLEGLNSLVEITDAELPRIR